MNRLDGKSALISGAATGIGAGTAGMLAEAGARVILGDISDEEGRAVAARIAAAGGVAHFIHLDVSSEADWAKAVTLAQKEFGGLDILVNNAGILFGRNVEEASLEDWQTMQAVNQAGTFLGTKHALPLLKKNALTSPQGSSIVNLSSVSGLVGSPIDPLYSMTKGGIALFTKATAVGFGRSGYRIRVNAVHPGVVETAQGRQTFAARARKLASGDAGEARSIALANHPIGRFGTVEDVANAIVFLASDDAGFITGSSLVVDGGLTAQ
ncbi:glucose 1-dehydrogenase [Mesorhizobium sp. 8]|uniref:SDR family NAD(P)-dependent oxidoreductase n=1 Tax=Mesorhizobium sp. 8 TaxID=2584466 RepID=UPI00111E680E|nr:glucose 1-dehydrogenase [Mesorhizobium sp. 8]QDC00699.1 glucose 1-dehydrogenase [Mesorhizobium sp. 8]